MCVFVCESVCVYLCVCECVCVCVCVCACVCVCEGEGCKDPKKSDMMLEHSLARHEELNPSGPIQPYQFIPNMPANILTLIQLNLLHVR